MEMTRRDLLKLAGTAAIGAVAVKFGGVEKMAEAKSSIKLTQAPVIGKLRGHGGESLFYAENRRGQLN